jgi:PAS domain S-box-containing protein
MASRGHQIEPLDIQLLVDSIPALIHTGRPDGHLDYFNKPWLEYLGVSLDQVTGWNWTAFIHPEDLDGIVTKWRGSLATGEIFEYETRVRRANGEYRWMFHRKVPSRDGYGNITKWFGSSIDIEDLKRREVGLRKADDKVRQNEKELRLIIETIPAFVGTALPDGTVDFVSQSWLDHTGLSREEWLGWGWTRVTHPEDLQNAVTRWKAAMSAGESLEHEQRIRLADGTYRWFLGRNVPLRDEKGSIIKWYGTLHDIEDRKRAEESVRSSEAYLAEAQRLSHTGSWAWSPDQDIRYWSEECYRVLSFDPQDGLPRFEEFFQRIHPDDQPGFSELMRTAVHEKAEWEADYRIVHPSGAIRNIHVVGHPVLSTYGNLVEFVGTVMDVTEHVRLSQELRRREAFLTEAQRVSHTGSFGWNPDSGDVIWSDETYRIFEYDPDVKPTPELVMERAHPDDRAKFQEVIARVAEGATRYEHTYRLLLPDGRVKHVRVIARIMELITGRPLFIGTVQDVTESKLAEDALNRARSELANVARITTLNALTASIAHEVNQPLAGIVTNASTCLRMLNSDPPNVDGARETARRTIRDGNRASDVITRLRALFSKKEFTLEPLDLNDAAREVIALSLSDLQRNRVILRSELAEDLPPVIGDRVQLQQVILNLVRNASDAMTAVEDRPRELLVRTEKDDGTEKDDLIEKDDCGRVRLSVKDAGVGFTPEARDKLFEAFYTTKNDGMGIGLSISRSIIDAHRGRLWAVPNDGPGATFSFSIPCRSGS